MDPAIKELYKCILCKNSNLYMSKNGYVIFVTWFEEVKGKFRRTGAGEPGRIKKVSFTMDKKKGTMKQVRMM